ncbi:MAG: hypothetical protein R8M46_02420 [Ghiorsea sp.]
MKQKVLEYQLTVIGTIVASFLYVASVSLQLDLFEYFQSFVERLEQVEIDELIFPFLIIVIFGVFDMRRRANLREVMLEKTRVKKRILQSSHHILNNFLSRMSLFTMVAERTPGFDPKILVLYENTIHDTSARLTELDHAVDEIVTHDSVIRERSNVVFDAKQELK